MKDEEINAAIAEALGFNVICGTVCEIRSNSYGDPEPSPIGFLPNYCADLNSMHEAEKQMDFSQCNRFTERLRVIGDANAELMGHEAENFYWHASARQRAEAFLRTIGKWKEEA